MTASPTLVPSAVAVLDPYVRAGVFEPSEVHVAATVARLGVQVSDLVILAVAVAARGPRLGHACVDLADVERLVVDTDEEQVSGLDWPGLDVWSEALAASDVVADPQRASLEPFLPLVWDGRRLYLQRYWDYEVTVADDLRARALSGVPATVETDAVGPALDRFFGPDDPVEPDLQRAAVRTALTHRVSVIAGGPGTGKTHTIAALLTALRQMPGPGGGTLRVALAAPTGKAAARMTEAVQQEAAVMAAGGDILEGVTLHRLLGWAPGTQFRHDRRNPLPYDVVIVDETSMVSLPLMAHLLSAMPPSARLVLVGDPFQLASIEAGSVLGDVVGPSSAGGKDNDGSPLSGRITTLRRMRRFTTGSSIAELSMDVRSGSCPTPMHTCGGFGPTTRRRSPRCARRWLRPAWRWSMPRQPVTPSAASRRRAVSRCCAPRATVHPGSTAGART
jgi:exodeoxyribonuclease V alpha subunit